MDASNTALESPKSILSNPNITQVIYLSFLSGITLYTFVMSCLLKDNLVFFSFTILFQKIK